MLSKHLSIFIPTLPIFLLAILWGCEEQSMISGVDQGVVTESERVWTDLISSNAWFIEGIETDPYAELLIDHQSCGVTDFGEEYGGVEISTVFCDYLTLTQPTLVKTQLGDLIEVVLWHAPLVSETPAEGLLSLHLGESLLWSKTLLIPSEAESWTLRFEVTTEYPTETPLRFHVHNHGANSYTLLSIKRGSIFNR